MGDNSLLPSPPDSGSKNPLVWALTIPFAPMTPPSMLTSSSSSSSSSHLDSSSSLKVVIVPDVSAADADKAEFASRSVFFVVPPRSLGLKQSFFVFLDVDGVIRPSATCEFSPFAMKHLKRIVFPGLHLVLSSEWRRHRFSRELVKSALEQTGIPCFVSWTPFDDGTRFKSRVQEIRHWLTTFASEHPTCQVSWIAVDDMNLSFQDKEFMKDHFVHTKPEEGITEKNVEEAIEMLKK